MIQINCPNCGPRNSQEFRYGGEYNPRPTQPIDASEGEWTNYLFLQENKLGVQKEWWYHRAGCGLWFLAERHTKTNQVERTFRWAKPEQDLS
jgi:heterotetrameric sarcosine oxidase delta subunit